MFNCCNNSRTNHTSAIKEAVREACAAAQCACEAARRAEAAACEAKQACKCAEEAAHRAECLLEDYLATTGSGCHCHC